MISYAAAMHRGTVTVTKVEMPGGWVIFIIMCIRKLWGAICVGVDS